MAACRRLPQEVFRTFQTRGSPGADLKHTWEYASHPAEEYSLWNKG